MYEVENERTNAKINAVLETVGTSERKAEITIEIQAARSNESALELSTL